MECLKNYGQRIVIQDVMTRTILKKKKCKTTKWLSEEAFKLLRKRKQQGMEKQKIYLTEYRFSENSRKR